MNVVGPNVVMLSVVAPKILFMTEAKSKEALSKCHEFTDVLATVNQPAKNFIGIIYIN
jgi:hypothetical protein